MPSTAVAAHAVFYRKYARATDDGSPRGFLTPSRRSELYSEQLLEIAADPLPAHEPPAWEPTPGYPLVLTCAKLPQYCQSQHRSLPRLRRAARHPTIALHPHAAAQRGIAADDWVHVATPDGCIRARAKLDPHLDARVAAATSAGGNGASRSASRPTTPSRATESYQAPSPSARWSKSSVSAS